jgi:hypothetical protein
MAGAAVANEGKILCRCYGIANVDVISCVDLAQSLLVIEIESITRQ